VQPPLPLDGALPVQTPLPLDRALSVQPCATLDGALPVQPFLSPSISIPLDDEYIISQSSWKTYFKQVFCLKNEELKRKVYSVPTESFLVVPVSRNGNCMPGAVISAINIAHR